jgi:ribonuclease R
MAKQRRRPDPHHEREAQKYEHPIPSREYILERLAARGSPASFAQIADELNLRSEQDLEALRRRLRAMERDAQIVVNRQGDYGLTQKMNAIAGRVVGHPDGFGFLVPDEGGDDLFLSPKQMRSLLHGDRILASVTGIDRRGRREGALVEVLERANQRIVGRFYMEHGVSFVTPSNSRINQDIAIPPEHRGGATLNQIVEVEIIEQPNPRSQPIGRITEVLGDHMAPGMEIDVAIRSHDLPYKWPEAVERESTDFGTEVPEAAKRGRIDLRPLPLVTIDGEDARDFDDAVYCEPHGRGWRLIVAIADVSSYVLPETALENEARLRGNSVYFPGKVIPMLPEVLSNGLCSLNPNVDRLCLACELIITGTGQVKEAKFFEGVMCSWARLTYTEVAAAVVARETKARNGLKRVLPHLEDLHALYQVLRRQRDRRGAIDFETTETKIVFGRERKIERIVPQERNDAHRMIEEFMVAANVAAAEFLLRHKIPALYRVHAGPTMEKLENLRAFLAELGLSLGGGEQPQPRHYAKLLDSVRDRPDARLIQTVLLRSLSQAVYSPDNTGHFGLAYDAYTHFTSPIRRFPDLLVHRAIRHLLAHKRAAGFIHGHGEMISAGEHCSMTERRADEATRDAVDWLKCEYMQDKVGETFDGLITAVTGFGLFVELRDVYVEGLLHISSLGQDYFHFDPLKHRLMGEHTRKVYRLADPIAVRVVRVDLDERKIDFALAEEMPQGKKGARAPRGKRTPRAKRPKR